MAMAVNLNGFRFLPAVAALMAGGAVASAQQAPSLVNLDMETPAAVDAGLPGWWGGRQPYRVSRDGTNPFAGSASARIESVAPPADNDFGAISQAVDATPYRGKRVRLRAAVRTEAAASAWAGLWLRVDREGGAAGFFDNMQDRPITDPAWQTYEIVGDVAPDAKQIVFGMLLSGGGKAWLDDVSLTVVGDAEPASVADAKANPRSVLAAAGPVRRAMVAGDAAPHELSGRGLTNLTALAHAYGYVAHFDATDAAAAADWPRIAIDAVRPVEAAHNSRELAEALNAAIRPHAPDFCAYPDGAPPPCGVLQPTGARGAVAWRHLGRELAVKGVYKSVRTPVPGVTPERVMTVDLGGGVTMRMPTAAWVDADGHSLAKPASAAPPSEKPAGWEPAGFDRSTRLADVIVAWNLFQHFYPYFDVVKADWPKVLEHALEHAAEDSDDRAFVGTLGTMVSALEDGHGNVLYAPPPAGVLPLAWDWVENKLVVTAVGSEITGLIKPGDVVERIDGAPALERIETEMAKASGSEQWRRVRALNALRMGEPGHAVTLTYARPGAGGIAGVAFVSRGAVEPRPVTLTEVRPGIVYVDVSRFTPQQLEAGMAKLAAAKGIVFDLRGYPNGSPEFLSHLSDTAFQSMPMRVPVVTQPDRKGWEYEENHWNMPALAPRFTHNVVFLTDARAISYAESILATVKGAKLGTIVGTPTAGANGNVNPLPLPGGYVLAWTGMQVLTSEGGTHHRIGVQPDVTATRTIEGVRAGRDEVLEKGLELLGAGK
jgi:hypothetical protein